MRRVEPDPDEVAEEGGEPGTVRFGQRRLQDRGDVAAQMLVVAGAEQHDIGPGLVAHEAIGGVDDAAGAAPMEVIVDKKSERVVGLGED